MDVALPNGVAKVDDCIASSGEALADAGLGCANASADDCEAIEVPGPEWGIERSLGPRARGRYVGSHAKGVLGRLSSCSHS